MKKIMDLNKEVLKCGKLNAAKQIQSFPTSE